MSKVTKIRSFDLRRVDFLTGKKVSPCKSEWNTCSCCGKKIVKGAILSNGHTIGEDCENVRFRVEHSYRGVEVEITALTKLFGLLPRVQAYMRELYVAA